MTIHLSILVFFPLLAGLLSAFSPRLSGLAQRTLSSRRVEVVLGAGVAGTDGKVVELQAQEGAQVSEGTLLVRIEKMEG